jgi:hypothetical protein
MTRTSGPVEFTYLEFIGGPRDGAVLRTTRDEPDQFLLIDPAPDADPQNFGPKPGGRGGVYELSNDGVMYVWRGEDYQDERLP